MLADDETATYTLFGKYSATETWVRKGDRISIDVNVLADTTSRKWVPNLSTFFRNDDVDFEQFRLRLNYDNAIGNQLTPLDLTGYSFNIDSRGRGHGMFQFNRYYEPFFVTTYTEVYILDKEYITIKEARKWENKKFDTTQIEIYEPTDAPELQSDILALIDRVNTIDEDKVKLSIAPDQRLVSRNVRKGNHSIGHRALTLLKQATGITYYRSHKNLDRNWNEFRDRQRENNDPRK